MVGCSITGCKSNSERKVGDVSFHTFPDDPELRSAWIAATKRIDWIPKNSSRICGRHFNAQLLRKKGKKTLLFPNAIPNMDSQTPMLLRDMALNADGQETLESKEENPRPLVGDDFNNEVQMCRICLETGDKLHSVKKDKKVNLAYETLTGLSIENGDNMPSHICDGCSQQLMQCIYFRDRSLRAHILLLDILKRHDCITVDLIKSVTECQDVNANLNSTHNPDQYDPKTVDNIKKENEQMNEPLCLSNDPNSTEEDRDIKDIVIKKEVDCSFSEDTPIDEDTVYSSTLHEDTFLGNIKVELEDGNEEKSMTDGDTASHDMLYSDTSESDVASAYTPVGQQEHKAEGSNSEVKRISKKTPKKLRQKSGAKLLVYDNLCCDVCSYKTASDVKLLRHFRTHHSTKSYINHETDSNENIYSCMLCEKTFNTKWGLVKHLKIHSGDKPYPCNECDKSFKENRDLQNHLRTHSGEKPFACDLCKRSFSERGNLLRHIRIHAGEKPYKCKYCKISFSQKHHLKRHLTRHC